MELNGVNAVVDVLDDSEEVLLPLLPLFEDEEDDVVATEEEGVFEGELSVLVLVCSPVLCALEEVPAVAA